jgi:hypothetical protein
MTFVRGSLVALALVLLACTATTNQSDPLANSSPTFTPVTSPQGSPEQPPPSRSEPAVLPSPSSPTPAPSLETPPPVQISSQEDNVQVRGLLVHPNLKPAVGVCIIVGPQAVRCAAISREDGTFVVALPKASDVNWTFRYFVGGEEKGHQTISGPFKQETFVLPAFSIP